MKKRRVILESPYKPNNPNKGSPEWHAELERNIRYARECLRDSLLRDEAPIASHLLYTQEGVLDDKVPEERMRGILAGLAWGEVAEASVVYCDLGISEGMRLGVERAEKEGRDVVTRYIYGSPDNAGS